MSAVVLDASALLAMLKDEAGGDAVAAVIPGARISAVNHAEVVSHFIHAGMPAAAVAAMLRALPLDIVPADAALGHAAGALRATTAALGLSLGDRFCLALAQRDGAVAWTADRQWAALPDPLARIVCVIR